MRPSHFPNAPSYSVARPSPLSQVSTVQPLADSHPPPWSSLAPSSAGSTPRPGPAQPPPRTAAPVQATKAGPVRRGPGRPRRAVPATPSFAGAAAFVRRGPGRPRPSTTILGGARPQPPAPPAARSTRRQATVGGDQAIEALLAVGERLLRAQSPEQQAVGMVSISNRIQRLYPSLLSAATMRAILDHKNGLDILEQTADRFAQLPSLGLGEDRIVKMIENEDGQSYLTVLRYSDTLIRNCFVGGLLSELTQEKKAQEKLTFLAEGKLDALRGLGVWATDALQLIASRAGTTSVQAVINYLPQLRARGFSVSEIVEAAVKSRFSSEIALSSMDATYDALQALSYTTADITAIVSVAPYQAILPLLCEHTEKFKQLGFTIAQVREISCYCGSEANLQTLARTAAPLLAMGIGHAQIVSMMTRRSGAGPLLSILDHGPLLMARGRFTVSQLVALATLAKSKELFEVTASYVSAFENDRLSPESFIAEIRGHDLDRVVRNATDLLRHFA